MPAEHVVLLDDRGRVSGTLPKSEAHHTSTALHLAFSCHVVDRAGRVLVSQRSPEKHTWPGTWSNACCGHPQLGETLRDAVERRVKEELGLAVDRMGVVLPDFTYRATMDDGTAEHELCPVLVVEIDGDPRPDPAEVGDVAWLEWPALLERATRSPGSLSPWSVAQIAELDGLAASPSIWLDSAAAQRSGSLLDSPVTFGEGLVRPTRPARSPFGPLDPVLGPLQDLLTRFLDGKASALSGVAPALAQIVEEIRGLVDAGGKRLRPAFVYWGLRAAGGDHDDRVLHPAAAIELLHTFALLHDDVMDRSETRRGQAAAHRSFAAHHEASGGAGDPAWFGASAAILAGDLADVWADELLATAAFPSGALHRARAVFTTLREEVIAGQYLDLLVAADATRDEARVRQVALLKSARYTVTRPLLLGAALALGGAARCRDSLLAYGDAVGFAFQLRDDILGLFGDPAATGKSDLDDLREGKRTLLILRALRLGRDCQRRVVEDGLGNPAIDEAGADRVRAAVAATGALASVEALLTAQHALALDAVRDLPEPARTALADLADLAIRRAT